MYSAGQNLPININRTPNATTPSNDLPMRVVPTIQISRGLGNLAELRPGALEQAPIVQSRQVRSEEQAIGNNATLPGTGDLSPSFRPGMNSNSLADISSVWTRQLKSEDLNRYGIIFSPVMVAADSKTNSLGIGISPPEWLPPELHENYAQAWEKVVEEKLVYYESNPLTWIGIEEPRKRYASFPDDESLKKFFEIEAQPILERFAKKAEEWKARECFRDEADIEFYNVLTASSSPPLIPATWRHDLRRSASNPNQPEHSIEEPVQPDALTYDANPWLAGDLDVLAEAPTDLLTAEEWNKREWQRVLQELGVPLAPSAEYDEGYFKVMMSSSDKTGKQNSNGTSDSSSVTANAERVDEEEGDDEFENAAEADLNTVKYRKGITPSREEVVAALRRHSVLTAAADELKIGVLKLQGLIQEYGLVTVKGNIYLSYEEVKNALERSKTKEEAADKLNISVYSLNLFIKRYDLGGSEPEARRAREVLDLIALNDGRYVFENGQPNYPGLDRELEWGDPRTVKRVLEREATRVRKTIAELVAAEIDGKPFTPAPEKEKQPDLRTHPLSARHVREVLAEANPELFTVDGKIKVLAVTRRLNEIHGEGFVGHSTTRKVVDEYLASKGTTVDDYRDPRFSDEAVLRDIEAIISSDPGRYLKADNTPQLLKIRDALRAMPMRSRMNDRVLADLLATRSPTEWAEFKNMDIVPTSLPEKPVQQNVTELFNEAEVDQALRQAQGDFEKARATLGIAPTYMEILIRKYGLDPLAYKPKVTENSVPYSRLGDSEKARVLRMKLRHHKGNRIQVAATLGISFDQVRRDMQRYGFDLDDFID